MISSIRSVRVSIGVSKQDTVKIMRGIRGTYQKEFGELDEITKR